MMTEKVIVITADNTISIKELEVRDGMILDGLQKIVGGWIENVHPMRLKPPLMLECNEEGLILGLPINPVASYLYGIDKHGSPITGDVAIVQQGWRDGEPDIVGIPDDAIERVYNEFIKTYPILKGAHHA